VLELAQRGDALALEVVQSTAAQPLLPSSVDERIVSALSDSDRPLPIAELRSLCRVRKATLYAHLTELVTTGRLVRSADGYRLAATA
jgi:predicted transcriptional regulator